MDVACTIQRFNPEKDARPHDVDYSIQVEDPNITVLDLLHELKERVDGSITFRRSCRSAICGSCSMRINGVTLLVCKTRVADAIKKGKLHIGPMTNFPVIKDLVTDMTAFWDKMHAVRPFMAERYGKDAPNPYNKMDPKFLKELDKMSTCINCATCYSDCEAFRVNRTFTGPAALTKAYRFAIDPRDRLGHLRAMEIGNTEGDGMWLCVICQNCQDHCPVGTRTIEGMDGLKNLATMQGQGHPGFDAAVGMLWKQSGRLYEVGEFENRTREKKGLPHLPSTGGPAMQRMLEKTGLAKATGVQK